MSLVAQEKRENVLYYFGDPICSWCYGFSPEITEIKNSLDSIDFEIVMGGLRPNGQEKISEMKDFLSEHWQHVNEASGMKFNYGILDSTEFLYDTEPAARSYVVANELDPETSFEFFKDVQILFYEENKNPSRVESYDQLISKYGLDKDSFYELFQSEKAKQLTRNHFLKSQEFGVGGFPSLVLKKGDKYYLISNGYNKSENIIPTINQVMSGEIGTE